MKTETLFQILEVGGRGFIRIELALPPTNEGTTQTVRTPDQVRDMLPEDPWADEPITWDSTGRALFGPTRVVPTCCRG